MNHSITTVTPSNVPSLAYDGKPVVTTAVLAQLYGAEQKHIQNNFKRNESRFERGKHFYKVEGGDLKDLKNRPSLRGFVGSRAKSLTLWTERGAARHAKMLETDNAWDVFEALEDHYFGPYLDNAQNLALPSTLTPAHQRELQKAIASRVYAQVPEARRPSAFKRLYSHLKDRFEVGSYKDIDESRYTEALGAVQSCELEGEWFAADQDREGLDMALDESDQQALFLMLSHAYWIHRIWRDENIEAALRMLGSPLAGRMHEHLSTADMCRRKLVSRHGDALYEMRKRAGCFEPPLSLH